MALRAETTETFKRRWGRLRENLQRFSLGKPGKPQAPSRPPHLRRMGTPYLAEEISKVGGPVAERFSAAHLQHWDHARSLPKIWHLEALKEVLVKHKWTENGLYDLLLQMSEPSIPEEEWLELLERLRPKLAVKWNESEGRWREVRRLVVELPHIAGGNFYAKEQLVDAILRAAKCECPTMAWILEGLDEAALAELLKRAKRLP